MYKRSRRCDGRSTDATNLIRSYGIHYVTRDNSLSVWHATMLSDKWIGRMIMTVKYEKRHHMCCILDLIQAWNIVRVFLNESDDI